MLEIQKTNFKNSKSIEIHLLLLWKFSYNVELRTTNLEPQLT